MNEVHTPLLIRVFDAVMAFLAAVGLMALAGLVGLYCAGFFHYLASKHPGSAVLQFFFGS